MADSFELTLQVCPAPEDDAGELAKLAEWLRGELLDLDVPGVGGLPGEAAPVGATGSADTAGLLLVQLERKAAQVVQAKVTDWVARSGRMVKINAEGHTLILRPPTRHQQEKDIDGLLAPGTEVSRVRQEGEAEAVIELTPSVALDRDSAAAEPGEALVPLRPRESLLPLIRERGELSRRNWLAEGLLGQEVRRTAAFVGFSSLFGGGLAILLLTAILAIARHHHRFSISTSYPFHRIYQAVAQYFIRITPPPGSSHMLLVSTIYLAVLPVLFAVVFMHLKTGSTGLIVATVACVTFMAAPFLIAFTSFRAGSTNCGSWIYPVHNSGSECYNILTSTFRIASAVGIVGLAFPVIYLIGGRLFGALIACASALMGVFIFISDLMRRRARGGRDVAEDQKGLGDVDQYLLPHEQEVISVRLHPAVLIGPSVLALDGLLVAGVLTATVLHGNGPLVTVVWLASLVLFARIIWKTFDWAASFFVITSHRFLLTSGVLTKKVAMMPLVKVTDMTFQRSYLGRLLGYGTFVLESAGSDQALSTVDHIPYPEQLYLEVCSLIFPSKDAPDG